MLRGLCAANLCFMAKTEAQMELSGAGVDPGQSPHLLEAQCSAALSAGVSVGVSGQQQQQVGIPLVLSLSSDVLLCNEGVTLGWQHCAEPCLAQPGMLAAPPCLVSLRSVAN